MRYLLIFLILFAFCSCKHALKKETPISLTITNKEIHYLKSDSVMMGAKEIRYGTLGDLMKARNIIEYEIKNNTDKNYLLLLDPYDILYNPDLEMVQKYPTRTLGFSIDNFDLVEYSGVNIGSEEYFDLLQIKQNLYRAKKSICVDSIYRKRHILEHAFVLNAHETKTFSAQLDLPIVEQSFVDNYFNFVVFYIFDKEYDFQLHYIMTSKKVEEVLKEEELEYFKENNINIFTGELRSNVVNLVPVE